MRDLPDFPAWLHRAFQTRFVVQKFTILMTCFIPPVFSTPDHQITLCRILTPGSTYPRACSGIQAQKHQNTKPKQILSIWRHYSDHLKLQELSKLAAEIKPSADHIRGYTTFSLGAPQTSSLVIASHQLQAQNTTSRLDQDYTIPGTGNIRARLIQGPGTASRRQIREDWRRLRNLCYWCDPSVSPF